VKGSKGRRGRLESRLGLVSSLSAWPALPTATIPFRPLFGVNSLLTRFSMSSSSFLRRLPRASCSRLVVSPTRSFSSSPSSSSPSPSAPLDQANSIQPAQQPTERMARFYPWSADPTLPVGDLFTAEGIKVSSRPSSHPCAPLALGLGALADASRSRTDTLGSPPCRLSLSTSTTRCSNV
jgi:hypothetical protein